MTDPPTPHALYSGESAGLDLDPARLSPTAAAQDMIAHYIADNPSILTSGPLAAAFAAVYVIEAAGYRIVRPEPQQQQRARKPQEAPST